MYSPNFIVENKIFVLNLHYNGDNSYLFVNSKTVTQFKAKNSEIGANQVFLGSLVGDKNYYDVSDLSKDDVNDIKLHGNIYDFSVDYSTISNDEVLKIHKYLMKKNGVCRLTSAVCNTTQVWNKDSVTKIWVIKWYVIKDILGILAIVLLNVISQAA